jgi:hypothetical protein
VDGLSWYIADVTKMKHILSAFVLTGISMPAHANNVGSGAQLKGDDLRAVFSDTVMVGEYQEYRGTTRTYNYTESHHADGTTDYVEGRKKEDGRWKIIGDDKICYKYPRSRYYTQTYCFFVFDVEGCYYKFTLQNMTLNRGPKNWDRWSSRAVRKGAGGSCGAPIG